MLWKVIYLCVLVPGRIFGAPLTNAVGSATDGGLNWFTHSHNYWSKSEPYPELNNNTEKNQAVYFKKEKLAGIYDACNALELFVLYT